MLSLVYLVGLERKMELSLLATTILESSSSFGYSEIIMSSSCMMMDERIAVKGPARRHELCLLAIFDFLVRIRFGHWIGRRPNNVRLHDSRVSQLRFS